MEIFGKGFGFLRDAGRNFTQSNTDTFVTPEVVRHHRRCDGIWIKGEIRQGHRGPQRFQWTELEEGNPEKYKNLPVFKELTTINPIEWIKLEITPERHTTRIIDLIAPNGKGQRGLLVAPPRTGKTTNSTRAAKPTSLSPFWPIACPSPCEPACVAMHLDLLPAPCSTSSPPSRGSTSTSQP